MFIIEKLLESFQLLTANLTNLTGISSFGPGWLFGAFSAVAVSLYGLSLGKTKAVVSLISIYIAFTLISLFPYLDKIDQITNNSFALYWLEIGIFLAAYIIIFLVFNFSFIRKKLSATEFSLFGVVLISLLQLVFLISIIFSMFPEPLALKLSFSAYNYLATQQALFFWAVAPLLVLLFFKNK